ncbi:uncharacterized protein [Epargyreus clarus]|uniref:uncharacterized protein isoform X2 n=1 Tax=Epargyreus clarus TaxID=520877 RepID=UPI003C2EC39A
MSYPPHQGPPPYQGYPPGAFAYVTPPMIVPYPPAPEPAPEPEPIDWVSVTPDTAYSLTGRALVVGREGWDGSPLWAIRAHHNGDFVPGKLAIKHKAAYIPHAGMEVPVHHFEVLCAPANAVRWANASNGQVPVGAIAAGNTQSAEPLYIGRVRHRGSVSPGKVHPSHGCCYISFSGSEISFKHYEVLCRISGY